jgi:hypothetical protein
VVELLTPSYHERAKPDWLSLKSLLLFLGVALKKLGLLIKMRNLVGNGLSYSLDASSSRLEVGLFHC